MAHSKQAKKRILQHERNRQRNIALRSKLRTYIKKARAAVEAKDHAVARTVYVETQSVIDRMVTKGVIHRNTASRLKSRLSARVKSLAV